VTCPGWHKLRAYQERAALALADPRWAGLWWAAGLGKTATTLAAWSQDERAPVLIVTRAIGRHVWPRDAEWMLEQPVSVLWGGKQYSKKGVHRDGTFSSLERALENASMVVTNYEVIGRRAQELAHVPWQWLILDEAHELKMGHRPPRKLQSGGYKKRRFEHAVELARQVRRRRGRVIQLTATPVRDRVRDLWAQMHIASPSRYPMWTRKSDERLGRLQWLERYCAAYRNDWGGLCTTGSSNLGELGTRCGHLFMVASRADVAHELPAVQRDVRLVTPDYSQCRYMGGGVEMAISRAAEAKEPFACETALEYLNQGCKVVLVTSRKKLVAHLTLALGKVVEKECREAVRDGVWLRSVTGDIDSRPRSAIAEEFQRYEGPAALIATADSVRTSMDLHQADGLVWCALPWTPHDLVQMEGRVGRLGGKPVTIHYLVAEGTIDEQVRRSLLDKLAVVEDVGADTEGGGAGRAALDEMRDEETVLAELRAWLGEDD